MGRDLDDQSQYHYQSRLAVRHIDLGGNKEVRVKISTDNLPPAEPRACQPRSTKQNRQPSVTKAESGRKEPLLLQYKIKTGYECFVSEC